MPRWRTSSASGLPTGWARARSSTARAAVELAGLDVGAGRRRRRAAASRPRFGRIAADRIHRDAQAAERLQWLPAVLVVLAPRALDERGELAVGIGVGPANPLQPRRGVVRRGRRDQPDDELHDPCRLGLDERGAELVQPQAHRPDATSAPSDMLMDAPSAARRIRPARSTSPIAMACCSAPLDVAPLLEARARPIVRRPHASTRPSDASRARRNAPNRW